MLVSVALGAALLAALVGYVLRSDYRERKGQILLERRLGAQVANWGAPGAEELLIFGDSHAARWSRASFSCLKVTMVGYPGQGAKNILASASRPLAESKPRHVIISLGGNDAAAMTAADRSVAQEIGPVLTSIDTLMATLAARGAKGFVILLPAPAARFHWLRVLMTGTRLSDGIQQWRQAMRSHFDGRAIIVDPVALRQSFAGTSVTLDGLHWSEGFYTMLAEHILAELKLPPCRKN